MFCVTSALVNRVNNRIAIRQRSNLHATVNAAREHPTELVDLYLCDALTHMLEEAAVLMLARVEEEWRAQRSCKCPDLNGKEQKRFEFLSIKS